VRILKNLFGQHDGGETPEFTAFVDGSVEGLQLQAAGHQDSWHFGEEERWDFSQDAGELVLTFPEVIARAPAQIIGTFDSNAGTWMWAWANLSVSDALKKDSIRVRDYGEAHRIARLTTPKWPADESECWRMTALASRLCESNGAYRGPAGSTFIFMTFGLVSLKKRP
jgi:hypothetical protein